MAKRTSTSSFGTGGRRSHDSSGFYSRRLYNDRIKEKGPNGKENPLPAEYTDRLICADAYGVLHKLPDNCIHLMITSPPYNVGKEYDEDLSLEEYLDFIEKIMREVYRVTVYGGRVCFNIANVGRKPYIPLHAYLIDIFTDIGFLFRGEVIWDKGDAVSGASTAWGSWMSPSNPILRDQHEYIIILSKGSYGRKVPGKKGDITREEFLEYTRSIWRFPPASARKIGHPAPFPEELPYRCIKLYSYPGDNVLDPFVGSGTTCIVAFRTGRHYLGIDVNPEYIKAAEKRLGESGGG